MIFLYPNHQKIISSCINCQLDNRKDLIMTQSELKELNLSSPLEYWKRKEVLHAIVGMVILVIILSLLSVTVYFLYNEYNSIKKLIDTEPKAAKDNLILSLLTLALIASFIYYGLRLLIRLFFHQMNTWSDAAERVLLIEVYKKNYSIVREHEASLIFKQIFKDHPNMSLENVDYKTAEPLEKIKDMLIGKK
jgi:hypothetical protein